MTIWAHGDADGVDAHIYSRRHLAAIPVDHIKSIARCIDHKYVVAMHSYGLGMGANKRGVTDR